MLHSLASGLGIFPTEWRRSLYPWVEEFVGGDPSSEGGRPLMGGVCWIYLGCCRLILHVSLSLNFKAPLDAQLSLALYGLP